MSAKAKAPPAWLCLRFTHLGLNSAGISADSALPSVVVEQQQLVECSHIASQSGLQIGMSLNHALMLSPALSLLERDASKEARKLQELSHWAYRFTSQVCVHKTDTLLLEVGRSISLFKGLKHLLNLINHDLERFGVDAVQGIGHTPKAAYVLSFNASLITENALSHTLSSLLAIELSKLDIEAKTIRQLHHCGFESLEDLEPIPASELGRRFGADFLVYMDQLWGRIADPQITTTPPETFAASADFAEPIRNLNWINQQLDRLLNDLMKFINLRQLICRSFTWRFYHENNRLLQTVTVGLSTKQNTFDTFRELSDLKLASLKLDWEFASIELSSTQLIPKTLFNDDLFNPKPDQEQFNQLIDKLTNRLGHHALFRVHAAPEHLPELANDRQTAVQESSPSYVMSSHTEMDEILKDQPLWLLENPQRLPQSPQPLVEKSPQPLVEKSPQRPVEKSPKQHAKQNNFRQPLLDGPLTIIHGPDRITSHWWSKIQSRDYFIARQRSGRLLWLFFDRDTRDWFLHGLFA